MSSDIDPSTVAERISAIEPNGNGSAPGVAARPIVNTGPIQFARSEVAAVESALRDGLTLRAKFFEKLRIAQHHIGLLAASGRHSQGFAYAKDEDITLAATEAAFEANLAILFGPTAFLAKDKPGTTAKGASITEGIVEVELVLGDCETGYERSMGKFKGVMTDYGGDGYYSKALTVAKKTALKTAFNMAVSDVPDPNAGKSPRGGTPPLSDEKGSITPEQLKKCRDAYDSFEAVNKEVARRETAALAKALGVQKFEELTERNAVEVPVKLQRMTDAAKKAAAATT